jgi:PAS domain S-box-containing protein
MNWELAAEQRDQFFKLTLDMLCISSGDGYFKWLNPAFTHTLGWSVDELLTHPYAYFVHPDDLAATLREVERQMEAGEKVLHFENRYRHKDGSWRVLSWKSTPFGGLMYAVARDVTERDRLKRALEATNTELGRRVRETEGIAHQVLQTAMSAYVRMSEDGRITEWNSQAERTFGWSREEAIGRLLAETIISPGQRDAHAHGLQHYVATGESRVLDKRIELQAVRRNGEEFPVEAVITAIGTKKGRVFSAFLRDVTERRRTEQQLQQVQKLEAVGQLTAGIAHDFNNLLGVVIGNLDAVLEDMDSGSETAGAITRALNGALHGAELTHRLLAFARQQDLEPKALSINDLLPDLVSILNRTLGDSISVKVVPSEDLWLAFADPSQVEDAVMNLAINARDAMPDGGTLTIETANVTLDEEYSRGNLDAKPGDYALLAVTDTGVGMTPEVMKHVMEPFFTTKPVGKGTGLGLSMIYGFTRQSAGHLRIYSEVGHGTTVKLYLPRARGVAITKPEPAEKAKSLTHGNETILVVEDNGELRQTAVSQLMKLGYRVLEAENGEAALAVLKGSDVIDLLFSDIVMTGQLTGRSLAQEARKFRPQMRILLTTGYAEKATADGTEGWQLLSKPYRQQELALKVRNILDGRGG